MYISVKQKDLYHSADNTVICQQMKTYYDVLKLDKDCSAKEIKDSYLNLSKKYHPDKNKSSDAHKKFVEVNEAYSVLGKPSSRHNYDESLSLRRQTVHYGVRPGPRTYENYAYAYAKNFKRPPENGPNINRPNISMIIICFAIMAVGSALQVKAELNRRYVTSQQIAAMYKEQKEHNKLMSREEKIEELKAAFLRNKLKKESLRKQ